MPFPRLLAPLALALLLAPSPEAQTPDAAEDPALLQRYQATITPAELAGHLYVYADDYMAGRDTGEPGQRFAADYLAGQYQTMGVAPKGSDAEAGNYGLAPYKQTFDLYGQTTPRASLSATAAGRTLFATEAGDAPDGRSYLIIGGEQTLEPTPVVFGGFGVRTDRYDDVTRLAQSGVEGSWLVLLDGDPTGPDGRSLATEDGEVSRAGGNAIAKIAALLRRGNAEFGVAGIVVISDDPASVEAGAMARAGQTRNLRVEAETESGGFLRPPVYVVTPELGDALLAPAGLTVAGLRADASDGEVLPAVTLPDTRLQAAVTEGVGTVETENVVAYIEGTDPVLKDEVVVISAHLDHIGDRDEGGDLVYNGADDDGSGTVSLLEIAEAFQTAKANGHGPRRSILFLHVTGEERGLLGSAYYADVDPRAPLAQTVANLNIDMIGRYDPRRGFETTDYVYIIGGDLISQDLHDWNATVNEVSGTDLLLSDRFNSPDDPNQFFRRSDHWNFGKNDIPFIFYFTGTHEDYHGVGDEADKIDYDRMARIARLIFGTAWHTANTDARPLVSGVGFN